MGMRGKIGEGNPLGEMAEVPGDVFPGKFRVNYGEIRTG